MKILVCTKCSDTRVVRDDEAFCWECGTRLIEFSKCRQCGNSVGLRAKFCSYCGEKISE